MKRSGRQIIRGVFIVLLLSVTVPWGATTYLNESWGPLPGWVWYALILNVIFAVVVCFLFEMWWTPETILSPEDEAGRSSPAVRKMNEDIS